MSTLYHQSSPAGDGASRSKAMLNKEDFEDWKSSLAKETSRDRRENNKTATEKSSTHKHTDKSLLCEEDTKLKMNELDELHAEYSSDRKMRAAYMGPGGQPHQQQLLKSYHHLKNMQGPLLVADNLAKYNGIAHAANTTPTRNGAGGPAYPGPAV